MRPSDPRLREVLTSARRPLLLVLGAAGVGALLVVAQAFVVAGFVVALVSGRTATGWGAAVVAVLSARALSGYVGDRAATSAAAAVGRRLRTRLVRSLLVPGPRPLSVGEASVLATRGVAAAEPYVTRYLPALVLAAVLPPVTVVALATQDLLAAVIVLATLPLVPVFGALVGMATRDRAQQQWRAMARLSGHFLDVVKGLPTLVAFRRAQAQSATIRAVTHRYREATARTLRIAFASAAVLELVATLSVAVVAVVVGVRLASGGLDLRTALVVLLLAPEAYWPLRRVGAEFHAAAEGTATIEQITGLPSPSRSSGRSGWALLAPPVGPLQAIGLSVVHPGRRVPALAPLTTTISARGVTAVVGPSGCGKSTLLRALAGVVEPSTGSVTVGGQPPGATWRTQVSWLPQSPAFLSGSVAENLRLARPEATDRQLWSALRRVALDERVRRLPAALSTPLGEDARLLSAGERARLALARVVLADRPWVLLDEPTAHLDARTEQVITDTIRELGRTRAVVVVAHRQAVVQVADRVLELAAPTSSTPVAPGEGPGECPGERPGDLPGPVRAVAPPADEPEPGPAGPALWRATLLGVLASACGVALTATAGWLIVTASAHPPVLTMLVAIVGVRAFGLGRPVFRYVERLVSHDAALRLLAEQRVAVYDALVPLVPGALGRRRGDTLAAVVDDAESVLDRELRVRMPARTAVLVVLLAAGVVGMLEPAAGAVVAGLGLLAGGGSFVAAGLAARRAERRAVAARADLAAQVTEVLHSAEELVMWQGEETALARVAEPARRLDGAWARSGAAGAFARAWTIALGGVGVAAVGLLTSGLSGPVQALVTLVPLALLEVLLPLAEAGPLACRTRAARDRLEAITARRPLVRDPAEPAELPAGRGITLRGVSAGWDGDPVLRGLSLEVAPGQRVGVVGPSGCGKSTLASLLLRFLDPADGEVRLGEAALDRLKLDDVRRTVGLVDDDPHVFATTLVENIRLARPSATDAEVEQVLRRAQLGEWLDALPEGLGSWLGDGHAAVSGGERARLAVARSLLSDPGVLVLDEPTAGLDARTAAAVADDVLGAAGGRAVVWITHGSVGLERMDRVLDLTPRDPRPRDRGHFGPG